MTIYQDLAIFNGLHLPFSVVSYSPFPKNEPVETWHNWLLSNCSWLLNWKEPGTYPQFSIYFKRLLKIIALAYIFQLTKSSVLMRCGSKDIYLKLHSVACTNTDHGITDLLNHGKVKSAKTWIHWEWNITFYYTFTFLSQLELSRIEVPKLTPGIFMKNCKHSIRPGWLILFYIMLQLIRRGILWKFMFELDVSSYSFKITFIFY